MRRLCVLGLAVALGMGLTATAYARFPRLNAAERSISNAIGHLQAAPNIYAGHKAEAIRLLRQAIGEIQAAKRAQRR